MAPWIWRGTRTRPPDTSRGEPGYSVRPHAGYDACRPRGAGRPVRTSRDQKPATSRPWPTGGCCGISAGSWWGRRSTGTVGGWPGRAGSAGDSSPSCLPVWGVSPEMIPARPSRYRDVMAARARVAGSSVSRVRWTLAAWRGCWGPLLTGDAFNGQRRTVRRSTATLIRQSRRCGGGPYFLLWSRVGRELSGRGTEGTWRPLSSSGSAVASSRSPVEQRAFSQGSSPSVRGGVRGRHSHRHRSHPSQARGLR
jgi:hypothetical protein